MVSVGQRVVVSACLRVVVARPQKRQALGWKVLPSPFTTLFSVVWDTPGVDMCECALLSLITKYLQQFVTCVVKFKQHFKIDDHIKFIWSDWFVSSARNSSPCISTFACRSCVRCTRKPNSSSIFTSISSFLCLCIFKFVLFILSQYLYQLEKINDLLFATNDFVQLKFNGYIYWLNGYFNSSLSPSTRARHSNGAHIHTAICRYVCALIFTCWVFCVN